MQTEPVVKAGQVSALVVDHPFIAARRFAVMQEGSNVAEIVAAAKLPLGAEIVVRLDGIELDPSIWRCVRPKAGRHEFTILGRPQGGQNPLRLLLTFALIIAVIATGQLELGTLGSEFGVTGALASTQVSTLVAGTLLFTGSLALNALIPPNVPSLKGAGATNTPKITGSRNRVDQFGSVTRLFGKHRIFPKMAALPFTEFGVPSNEMFLRLLFEVGYGPLELSDMRIGSTPITEFDGIETNILTGSASDPALKLYTNDVDQDNFQAKLTTDVRLTRTTRVNALEASLDILFPRGLVFLTSKGNHNNNFVSHKIEYRAVGDPTWILHEDLFLQSRHAGWFVKTRRIVFPSVGQYEVSVTRHAVGSEDNEGNQISASTFATLRTIHAAAPVKDTTGKSYVEMRIKATDQLSGILDTFNLIAESKLLDYHGETGVEVIASNAYDFEDGATTGWMTIGTNVALTNSGVEFHGGAKSLKCNTTDASPDFLGAKITPVLNPARGTIVRCGLWVRAGTANLDGETIQVAIREIGGAAADAATAVNLTLSNTEWRFVSAERTVAEADRTSVDARIRVDGGVVSMVAGDHVYFDDVQASSFLDHGVEPGDDVITNGDFETDTAGWIPNGTGVTIASSADVAFIGSRSCKIVPGSVAFARALYQFSTIGDEDFRAKGAKFRARAWVRSNASASGKNCTASLSEAGGPATNGPMAGGLDAQTVVMSDTAWTELTVEGTIGNDGRTVGQLTIGPTSGAASGDLIYVDKVELLALWSVRATSNPAAAYREVLQGKAAKTPVADSSLDLPGLEQWAIDSKANGFEFNFILDAFINRVEMLRNITSSAKASFNVSDGKFGVVQDKRRTLVVQHFTERNSSNFRATRLFLEKPHAFRVEFVDEDADYQLDERIVPFDGFSIDTASKFERLEMAGVTNAEQVFKLARNFQKQAELRPETYQLTVDLEHLVATRGDLVRVSHDVLLVGLASGRVKSIVESGGNQTDVTLDQIVTMESGKSYAIRIRRRDDMLSVVHAVDTAVGDSATLTLMTAIPTPGSTDISVGDLVSFGEAGKETVPMIVKAIEPRGNLGAVLTLLDEGDAIHDAATEPAPPFDPGITIPPEVKAKTPPSAILLALQSDESVLVRGQDGSFISQIRIALAAKLGRPGDLPVAVFQVQFRRLGDATTDNPWSTLPNVPLSSSVAFIAGVEDAETYQVRARTVADTGEVSSWVSTEHTVVGQSTPPPDITFAIVELPFLVWTYPSPPSDHAGFEVRFRMGNDATWDGATPLSDTIFTETKADLTPIPAGTAAVMVKAIDVAGNVSVNAAVVIVDVGDPIDPLELNKVQETDERALSWPGTITGGAVDGNGDIAASANTAMAWTGDDAAKTWSGNDSALTWSDPFVPIVYTATFHPEREWLPAKLLASASGVLLAALAYRTHGDTPAWSGDDSALTWSGTDSNPTWTALGSFKTWPGIIDARAQGYDVRLTTFGGRSASKITAMSEFLHKPSIIETLANIGITSLGTRLPITKAFATITNVSVTIQDVGTGVLSVKVVDKNSTGPLIRAFDINNNPVSANVDATVQGF